VSRRPTTAVGVVVIGVFRPREAARSSGTLAGVRGMMRHEEMNAERE